jgi:hypothetical protein
MSLFTGYPPIFLASFTFSKFGSLVGDKLNLLLMPRIDPSFFDLTLDKYLDFV